MFSELPKVLILGAIAAASAFVVTILIVLVCVGCQRKNKSKHGHGSGAENETTALRQSKLNSMSKSDTRLNDTPCNANGAPKSRPASMDLLLLHTRPSNSDLRTSPARQPPRVPARSEQPLLCPDDGLYESVGVKREAGPEPANTTPQRHAHASPNQSAAVSQVTAEYATIRKVKKLERGRKEEGLDNGDTENAPPRKAPDPFHLPHFPKEAVFMGNGEQYIWKPPEEDEGAVPGLPQLENGHTHPTATEISDMYSTVCKTLKRKQQQEQQEEEPEEKAWPRGLAQDSDPAYATIDPHRKREKLATYTLKPKKKAGPGAGPGRALTCENFYETIGDGKQGANAASTTTIFTFNDGMEMHVTGL